MQIKNVFLRIVIMQRIFTTVHNVISFDKRKDQQNELYISNYTVVFELCLLNLKVFSDNVQG